MSGNVIELCSAVSSLKASRIRQKPTPRKEQHKHHGEDTVVKRDEKDNPFAFKILDESVTKELLELEIDDMEKKMAEVMELANHCTDLGEASLLDYYVGALWWAKEAGFDPMRASAFFTAACVLLENIREKQMGCADNIRELSAMLSGAGTPSTNPGGLDIFSVAQGKEIATYFHKVLFQHYKLYQYMFTHSQAGEVIGLDLTVEMPKAADIPWPPPLSEGIPKALYDKHVKTPPPSPTPEEKKESEDAEKKAEEEAALEKEVKLLASLSTSEVQEVVDLVTKEIFSGLEDEVKVKLREKENTILTRINKIHKLAD